MEGVASRSFALSERTYRGVTDVLVTVRGIGELTKLLRELAEDSGVSERTLWRRVAQLREGKALPDPDRPCVECRQSLPDGCRISRVYCSGRCRVAAFRKRKLR